MDVFAMRVNCDTQRISPCMSLTFAFHISPEGLENTFRDNLGETESLAAEELAWHGLGLGLNEKTHIFFARFSTSETLSSVRPYSQLQLVLLLHEDLRLCTDTDAHKHHQTPRDLGYNFAVHWRTVTI